VPEPSDEMIEAAAEVLADREVYREEVRLALAAALSVGDEREQWRLTTEPQFGARRMLWKDYYSRPNADDGLARCQALGYKARIESRTHRTFPDGSVLTSPWREVDHVSD
jgi:hypothetical protein